MQDKAYTYIYFLGIGGIGMSALARYCVHEGYQVLGYDRVHSPITNELEKEHIPITFDEDIANGLTCSTEQGLTPENTLVVRTPAVPQEQPIYTRFREKGFKIVKRAELLGMVTRCKQALCVAGTHGKTTTSTLLAHILRQSHIGVNAFLGGISNNYQTNLLLDKNSPYVVVEADEFDRSFHHLRPTMSVITSIEPDHLDIYDTPAGYQEGFDTYASLVSDMILLKKGFHLDRQRLHAKVLTYALEASNDSQQADYYAQNIRVRDGEIYFDFVRPQLPPLTDIHLGVSVWVNIENAVAAMAMASLSGATDDELRQGVESFTGVWRRFNRWVKNERVVYIDDYAHHPTELRQAMESVRRVYPQRELIVSFQPHLYTRTRDFMDEFAEVLSTADRLILLPIYPARELPIEGITSDALATDCKQRNNRLQVEVIDKNRLPQHFHEIARTSTRPVVLMTMGAGDIDRLVGEIHKTLSRQNL